MKSNCYHGDKAKYIRSTLPFVRHSRINLFLTKISHSCMKGVMRYLGGIFFFKISNDLDKYLLRHSTYVQVSDVGTKTLKHLSKENFNKTSEIKELFSPILIISQVLYKVNCPSFSVGCFPKS